MRVNVIDATTLGKRTEGVPKWQCGLSGEYAVAGVKGLFVNGGINFVTSRPIDAQNSGFVKGYELIDADVRYEAKVGETPLTLRLIGKNLFDRYYYNSVFFQGGLEVGPPREVCPVGYRPLLTGMPAARQFWVIFHRWAGLTIALFLAVAGFTGIFLAWKDQLEAMIAPELHALRRLPRCSPC